MESCWASESSGLTEDCFGCSGFQFVIELMAGNNLVPLTPAFAAGVHPVSLLVSTEHKHWGGNFIGNYVQKPCVVVLLHL